MNNFQKNYCKGSIRRWLEARWQASTYGGKKVINPTVFPSGKQAQIEKKNKGENIDEQLKLKPSGL